MSVGEIIHSRSAGEILEHRKILKKEGEPIMKRKIGTLLTLFICLVFLSLIQAASADNASAEQKEKAALYILSKTDTNSVTDGELVRVYREADASLIFQIRDGLASRGMKVNIVESEQVIAADPTRYVLLVKVEKIELGAKRPFGRTAKVKVSYTVQNKDRFDLIKRTHEETSVQRWENCVKKISEQLVDDVSNDVAKKPVSTKPEVKQDTEKQAPAGSSAEARLQELKNLKAKGLITEKEYEAKRKEILNEL